MTYPVLLIMGVSGSGKTTIGSLLAQQLGWTFLDGDDLHPPANVAKMAAGQPLTDTDRWPWLAAIAGWIDARRAAGEPGIIACSALKRSYRDYLRTGRPQVRVVYLAGDRRLLTERLAHRHGHFFPADLLDEQLADLQEPAPDEDVLTVPIEGSPAEVVTQVQQGLAR